MPAPTRFFALALTLILCACGSTDDESVVGQIGVSDGSGASDGGTLADGAPAGQDGATTVDGKGGGGTTKDGGGSTVKSDGGTVIKDGGGAVKDSGGGVKDGGGTTTKDGGGTTTKDSGPVDTAGDKDKKYQSCDVLLQCAFIACDLDNKPGCEKLCTKQATSLLSAKFTPFAQCLWGDCMPGCAGIKDKDKAEQCGKDCFGKCVSLAYGCYANGAVGKDDCSDGWSCIEKCQQKPDNDFLKCNGDCYADLSAEAQQQFDAYAKCLAAGKGENIIAGCIQPLLACAADGEVGKDECYELIDCVSDCDKGMGNIACSGKCYADGTKTAQKQYADAFACAVVADSSKEKDGMACMDKLLICADPSGKQTCAELTGCTHECMKLGDNGGACLYKCLHKGTKASAKALIETLACDDKKKKGDPKACLQPVLKCADPKGQGACLTIWPCVGECMKGGKNGGVCYYECLGKATLKDATAHLELVICNDVNCNPVCDKKPEGAEKEACKNTCQKDKCKAELLACL